MIGGCSKISRAPLTPLEFQRLVKCAAIGFRKQIFIQEICIASVVGFTFGFYHQDKIPRFQRTSHRTNHLFHVNDKFYVSTQPLKTFRPGYLVIYWVTGVCVCVCMYGGVVYTVVAISAKMKDRRLTRTSNRWPSCQNIHDLVIPYRYSEEEIHAASFK